MIQKAIDVLFGSKHEKDLEELLPIVGRINERESWAMALDASQFPQQTRSAEHTSALQSLSHTSYPVFCLKK